MSPNQELVVQRPEEASDDNDLKKEEEKSAFIMTEELARIAKDELGEDDNVSQRKISY